MKKKTKITNKHLIIAISILIVLAAANIVQSYGTSNPIVIGHTWEELDGIPVDITDGDDECTVSGDTITCSSGALTETRCDSSGTCSQVCIGSACRSSWPSGCNPSCSYSLTPCYNRNVVGSGMITCNSGDVNVGIRQVQVGATVRVEEIRCCHISLSCSC